MKKLPDQKVRCSECGEFATADQLCCVDKVPSPEVLSILHACKCGANALSEPSHCVSCGSLWQQREHVEYCLGDQLAAVTDRGVHHRSNEDDVRITLEQEGDKTYKIMVVSDGLSSAQLAHEASAAASQAAMESLTESVCRDGWRQPVQAMDKAILKAHEALCTIQFKEKKDKGPPGATIVAAVLSGTKATIGWVGDSRAYIASTFGSKLLTRDHTWLNEVVDSGRMTEEEALKLVNPHVLTRCLGPMELDSSGEPPTSAVVSVELPALSWLVLCSDGLWNYDEKLHKFDAIIRSSTERACALTFARQLVSFANARGGRDNITVAVAGTN